MNKKGKSKKEEGAKKGDEFNTRAKKKRAKKRGEKGGIQLLLFWTIRNSGKGKVDFLRFR